MVEKTKIAGGIFLALVLALSLVGISYYFPSTETEFNSVNPIGELPEWFSSTTEEGTNQSQQPIFSLYFVTDLENITIRADGTIEPQNAPIQRIGDTYTLTGDIINQTLRIHRDNIVVDGAGFAIQGFINSSKFAYHGIIVEGGNNVTLQNFVINHFWHAILIEDCLSIKVSGNNLTQMNVGIKMDSCNNSVIENNIESGTVTAIEISNSYWRTESSNVTVRKNWLYDATTGISISRSSSNTVAENVFVNVFTPIGASGNYTLISKNTMINGGYGIRIGGVYSYDVVNYTSGSHCTIYGNNITSFSEAGITVASGTSNTIYENSISNSKCAVSLDNFGEIWIVENNTFYHNNFINCTQTVQVDLPSHINYWDNGSEGNYWSNYNGTDSNGDGIGDTEHEIDANNIDRYPLMSPYEIEQTTNMLFVYLGIIGLIVFVAVVIALMWINKRKDS